MLKFNIKNDTDNNQYIETNIDGKALLTISQLNKGTAFSIEERHAFKLTGKLPVKVETIEEQAARCYAQYRSFDKQINRNIYLYQLLNHNQVLFYKLVSDHLIEMLPTIYTPIVGNAVKEFNKKFMQPRGLYIAYEQQDQIEEILNNRSNPNVNLVVVSDGEGVLGIGDQGIGGMAIPQAKLMVYTAFGQINPLNTLPILLDAGTNNEKLLNDPLYLGWKHPRIAGKEYDAFVDKFIQATKKTFPHVFLHWEDFGRNNARRNLDAYRKKICSFNDDIQGTGIVAVAALLAALRRNKTDIKEQRVVIFGAGTAGTGITDAICKAFIDAGLSEEEAQRRFWLLDREGLITIHSNDVTFGQSPYVRTQNDIKDWSLKNDSEINLLDTIKNVKPTVLIGCSAQQGAFTKKMIQEMAKHVERPIIFPLSNPPELCEATPKDILTWTKGNALVATGSPFEPVVLKGKTYTISQCNNYLAFPGLGLGIIAVKARSLTSNMITAASQALSKYTVDYEYTLLPTIKDAQDASREVAIAVASAAIEDGVSDAKDTSDIASLVDKTRWEPHYLPYHFIE